MYGQVLGSAGRNRRHPVATGISWLNPEMLMKEVTQDSHHAVLNPEILSDLLDVIAKGFRWFSMSVSDQIRSCF
jgi:hypothetical protein